MLKTLHSSRNQITRSMSTRNVVVTGLGLVTPLGVGVQQSWKNLLDSKSGIKKFELEENLPCKVAGRVHETFNQTKYKKKVGRSVTLSTSYALCAADEALKDAGWNPTSPKDQMRSGVCVGSSLVDLNLVADTVRKVQSNGYRQVSPFFIPAILTNMAAGLISAEHQLKGLNHSVSTACATGAHAIGDAFNFIKSGNCDVILCGGTEANLNLLSMAGFLKMRALCCSYNNEPEKSSRPFDAARCGFVMGEGSGMMVLEEESHAVARGAEIYARVRGYGLSGDASNQITAPHPEGEGSLACMQSAVSSSQVDVNEISYINAHATSTKLGDLSETRAIKQLIGDRALDFDKFAVSSTKGSTGHLLGAAGAVEAIFTVLSCYDAVLPPTLNLDSTEEGMNLNYVGNFKQDWNEKHRVALSNSFGFGGTNASLCFSNYC